MKFSDHPAATRWALAMAVAACLAACGSSDDGTPPVAGSDGPIAMIVVNRMPIPAPCMGASLTFFEGTTPVDIDDQAQKTVQVSPLFGAYQIGFQVNGWYWRTCTSPGDCPNPNACQNPDNAGQVAIQIAADCSTATLVQNDSELTCDDLVPNASQAVTVTLQSSDPCTVVVAPTSIPLVPADACCSCSTCTGSQIPAGQVPHCQ
jgi:hypothetical protein